MRAAAQLLDQGRADDGVLFTVGLEIRREIFAGELATFKKAALPLAAAVGGMLVPAAIFAALNVGRAGAVGWVIPMATDIAFAVGVLTLLGSRVPPGLRILLLALAVIDDIGAIIVIACLYSTGISFHGLAIVAAGIGAVLLVRAAGVRSPLAYVTPGAVIWLGLRVVGIHPTILVGLAFRNSRRLTLHQGATFRLEAWIIQLCFASPAPARSTTSSPRSDSRRRGPRRQR